MAKAIINEVVIIEGVAVVKYQSGATKRFNLENLPGTVKTWMSSNSPAPMTAATVEEEPAPAREEEPAPAVLLPEVQAFEAPVALEVTEEEPAEEAPAEEAPAEEPQEAESRGENILAKALWGAAFWGLDAVYAALGVWDRVAIAAPDLVRGAWATLAAILAAVVPVLAAWAQASGKMARKAAPVVLAGVLACIRAAAGWGLAGVLAGAGAAVKAGKAVAAGWQWRADLIQEAA